MTGIIDYGAGNITSVERTLSSIGAPFLTSKNPSDLENCNRIIFPGVGDAAFAMSRLKKTGFDLFLRECVLSDRKLMGICLGSQIVFDYSEEDDTDCLGLLRGTIKHFTNIPSFKTAMQKTAADKADLKIPHMGWNDITYTEQNCPLFEGIPEETDMYFVHSYVIQPQDVSAVCAYTAYGIQVPAAIHVKNIYACQFHPEKSGIRGLRILRNFAELKV